MSNDLTQIFGQDFDMDSIEPASDFIPPGKFPCLIEKAELKENKKGTGHLIALVLSVLEDSHRNRKLFLNINIVNPNEQCTEIGRRTLRSLWDALHLPPITPGEDHISQLLEKVVIAHVRVKNGQNEVNTFSTPSAAVSVVVPASPTPMIGHPGQHTSGIHRGEIPVTQQTPPSGTSPAAAHTASKRPWEK